VVPHVGAVITGSRVPAVSLASPSDVPALDGDASAHRGFFFRLALRESPGMGLGIGLFLVTGHPRGAPGDDGREAARSDWGAEHHRPK
jgi:hypothetical protein